jgi:hypothetical protein
MKHQSPSGKSSLIKPPEAILGLAGLSLLSCCWCILGSWDLLGVGLFLCMHLVTGFIWDGQAP